MLNAYGIILGVNCRSFTVFSRRFFRWCVRSHFTTTLHHPPSRHSLKSIATGAQTTSQAVGAQLISAVPEPNSANQENNDKEFLAHAPEFYCGRANSEDSGCLPSRPGLLVTRDLCVS